MMAAKYVVAHVIAQSAIAKSFEIQMKPPFKVEKINKRLGILELHIGFTLAFILQLLDNEVRPMKDFILNSTLILRVIHYWHRRSQWQDNKMKVKVFLIRFKSCSRDTDSISFILLLQVHHEGQYNLLANFSL